MKTKQVCRHGVSMAEVCERCTIARAREARETPHERQSRRIGGQLTKRYREGEFDEPPPGSSRDVRAWSRYWSEIWKDRKAAQRANRTERGEPDPVPEPRPELWGYMAWALEERADRFTPAQRQALELTYGQGLSQREAAEEASRLLGRPVSRSAYRKWLVGAERVLRIILWAEAGVDGRRPSEVRRGRNAGRAEL